MATYSPYINYVRSIDPYAIILPLQTSANDVGTMGKTVTVTGSPTYRTDGPTEAIPGCIRFSGANDQHLTINSPDVFTPESTVFEVEGTGAFPGSFNMQGIVRHVMPDGTPVYIMSYGTGTTSTTIGVHYRDGSKYPSSANHLKISGSEIFSNGQLASGLEAYTLNHIGDIDIGRGVLAVLAEHNNINTNGVNRQVLYFDPDTLEFVVGRLFDNDTGGTPAVNVYSDGFHPTNQPSAVSGGIAYDPNNDEWLICDYTADSGVEIIRMHGANTVNPDYVGTVADLCLTKYTVGGVTSINREGFAIDTATGYLHVSTGAVDTSRSICVYKLNNGTATASYLYKYGVLGAGQGIDIDSSADPIQIHQVYRVVPSGGTDQTVRTHLLKRNNANGVTIMGWFRLYDLTSASTNPQYAAALYGDTSLAPDPQVAMVARNTSYSNNALAVANSVSDASGVVLTEDVWYHFALSCGSGSNHAIMYINGAATTTDITLAAEVYSYDRLLVAFRESGSLEPFADAAMVTLVHAELSAAQILGAYQKSSEVQPVGGRLRSGTKRTRVR